MEGALDFLKHLKEKQIETFIVSNKEKSLLEKEVNFCFPSFSFNRIVGNGEVLRNKPFPDAIFLALENVDFQINPENVWMIGDSFPDYACAISANIRPWLIENKHLSEIEGDISSCIFKNFDELGRNIF